LFLLVLKYGGNLNKAHELLKWNDKYGLRDKIENLIPFQEYMFSDKVNFDTTTITDISKVLCSTTFNVYLKRLIVENHPKLKNVTFLDFCVQSYIKYSHNKNTSSERLKELHNNIYNLINAKGVFSCDNLSVLRKWFGTYSESTSLFIDLKNKLEKENEMKLKEYCKPGGEAYMQALNEAIANGLVKD
jgi:hypothetical protein